MADIKTPAQSAAAPSSDASPSSDALRRYLPLGVDVRGRACVVVGGGRVGARKAATLSAAGADVTVVSPELSAALEAQVEAGAVRWVKAVYDPSHLRDAAMVVAATDDPERNIRISRDAERAGALACVVSPGRFSRVIFPAVRTADGITVAVHSDGRDCRRSRDVRDRIAAVLDDEPVRTAEFHVVGVRADALPPAVFESLKAGLPTGSPAADGFVLATCRRWELWCAHESAAALWSAGRELIQTRGGVTVEAHAGAFYRKAGAAALHHALGVVTGLDSPLRGETDVVAQVREAVDRCGLPESSLARDVAEWALRAQKRIRSDSGMSSVGANWADATVRALGSGLGGLDGRSVVIHGCGRLARTVAAGLAAQGARVLAVSRRADAPDLAGWMGVPRVYPDSDVDALVARADAILISRPPSTARRAAWDRAAAHGELVLVDLAARVAEAPPSPPQVAAFVRAGRMTVEQALRRFRRTVPDAGARVIRLGGRASALSRAQMDEVAGYLRVLAPRAIVRAVALDTPGDRDRATPLPVVTQGDFFTRDIDEALRAGDVDVAVHSAKDLPDELPADLDVAAVTPSPAPWDCLVARDGLSLAGLPPGSRVGTSSERRAAALRRLRPDLEAVNIRGNVPDRVRQVDAGDYDAVLLAAVGLARLGLTDRITHVFSPADLPPAPGQGSYALMVRRGDPITETLRPLDLGDREGLPWAQA